MGFLRSKHIYFSVYLNRVNCGIDYGFELFSFYPLSDSMPWDRFIELRTRASAFTSIGIGSGGLSLLIKRQMYHLKGHRLS